MPIKESLQGSVDKEVRGEILPKTELLGGLTDLNMTKKSTMDHHQYTLRG